MTKLAQHIADLLKLGECVVLPGLGGFVSQSQPARKDATNGKLYPPHNRPAFNQSLTNDDGIMATHLAETLNVSRKDASDRLHKAVDKLKKTLQEEGAVTLKGIGTLKRTSGDQLFFEPDETGIEMPAFYGLTSVPVKQLRTYPTSAPKAAKRPLSRQWYAAAAILLPLIVAGVTLSIWYAPPFVDRHVSDFTSYLYTQEETDAKHSEAYGHSSEFVSNGQFIVGAGPSKESPDNVPNRSQASRHYIIGGSFSQQSNAISFAENYARQGFDTEILPSEGNMYRVALAGFTHQARAEEELQVIQSNNISEAWILTN